MPCIAINQAFPSRIGHRPLSRPLRRWTTDPTTPIKPGERIDEARLFGGLAPCRADRSRSAASRHGAPPGQCTGPPFLSADGRRESGSRPQPDLAGKSSRANPSRFGAVGRRAREEAYTTAGDAAGGSGWGELRTALTAPMASTVCANRIQRSAVSVSSNCRSGSLVRLAARRHSSALRRYWSPSRITTPVQTRSTGASFQRIIDKV